MQENIEVRTSLIHVNKTFSNVGVSFGRTSLSLSPMYFLFLFPPRKFFPLGSSFLYSGNEAPDPRLRPFPDPGSRLGHPLFQAKKTNVSLNY